MSPCQRLVIRDSDLEALHCCSEYKLVLRTEISELVLFY